MTATRTRLARLARPARPARLAVGVAVATVTLLLGAPQPGHAHTGGGVDASDYTVTARLPAGVPATVEVGPGGAWTALVPHGARELEVLGYRGEPFLRWRAGQVSANAASLTAVRTGTLGFEQRKDSPEPVWVALPAATRLRWYDARADALRPPGPIPSPGGQAVFAIPIRVDGVDATVAGVIRHVPGPSPIAPLAALAGLASVVTWAAGRRRGDVVLILVAATAGLANVAHIVGATIAGQAGGGWGGVLGSLAAGLLCWPFMAAAVVTGLRGSEHAPFLHMLAGASLLIVGGPSDAVSMWRSQLVFAGPAWVDRVLVVACFGLGLGLLVGGYRRLAQASRPPTLEVVHS